MLVVFGGYERDALAFTVLEAEAELTLVQRAVLRDLPSETLSKAINKPAFIDVTCSAVLAALILKNAAEAVEVLRRHQHLALVNVVVVLLDGHQLALETIRLVNLRLQVRVLQVIERLDLVVVGDPAGLDAEELARNLPNLEQQILIAVFAEVLTNELEVLLVHRLDLLLFKFLQERVLAVVQYLEHANLLALLEYLGLFAGLHDNGMLLLSDAGEQHSLAGVDEAVITVDEFANLALIHRTMSLIVTFVAAVPLLIIRLEQGEFDFTRVVGHLEVEIPEAVLVEAVSLVDERLALLEAQQVQGKRKLIHARMGHTRMILSLGQLNVFLHGQLLWRLRAIRKLQGAGKLLLKFFELLVLLILNVVALELLQDLADIVMAMMQFLVLEVGASEPITTQVAINFDLGTFELNVLLDAFECLDLLEASETLNLEAVALVLDVLLQVLQVHALLNLHLIAAMQHLDLAEHGRE